MLHRLPLLFSILFEPTLAVLPSWIWPGMQTIGLNQKIMDLKDRVDMRDQDDGSSTSVKSYFQTYVNGSGLLVVDKEQLMPYEVVKLRDFRNEDEEIKFQNDINFLNKKLSQSVVRITHLVEDKLTFVQQSINVVGLKHKLQSIRAQSNQQVLSKKTIIPLD